MTVESDGAARNSPPTAAAAAVARAERIDTMPPGIGLGGTCPSSTGASAMSFNAPIANCSNIIDNPSRSEVSAPPPAIAAVAATTSPSRTEGNGWTSRMSAPRRATDRSDVDELVEVLHEVVDQPLPAVLGLQPDPRNEGVEGDGRDHLAALGISADRRYGTVPRSEHPFDIGLGQLGSLAEVRED